MTNKDWPTGQIALCFVDMQGSTELLIELGEDYGELVGNFLAIVEEGVTRNAGYVVDVAGDGAFCVFAKIEDGLAFVLGAQRAITEAVWPRDVKVRARMGLHPGEPRLDRGRYVGLDVHLAARIADAANGGQIILSEAAQAALDGSPAATGTNIRELGSHRLKGLRYPERLFDIAVNGLDSEFPAVRSLDQHPNNLPSRATRFVGRDGLLARTRELVRSGEQRLITFTGPGGIGKTSVSVEAARGLIDDFADGVFVVHLADVNRANLVALEIALVLGLLETPGRPIVETLKRYLESRRVLLILDNLEQVTEVVGELDELLAGCSGLSMLVTSRRELGSRFESILPVPPLANGSAEGNGSDELGEAATLFIERVRDYRRDYAPTAEESQTVAEICARLDGMPLAIELMASRMRLSTPAKLLASLAGVLDLPKKGQRSASERHRTLRAAIDGSVDMLKDSSKELFFRLAVFAGACSVEAVESVCSLGNDDVLTDLEDLLEHSLVLVQSYAGEPRIRMLAPLRQYAQEALAKTDEEAELRTRHARWFADELRAVAPSLIGGDQKQLALQIDGNLPNYRQALHNALAVGDRETAADVQHALLWWWIPRGAFTEALAWCDEVDLSHSLDPAPPRAKAIAAEMRGWLCTMAGDYEGARPHAETALALYEELGEPNAVRRAKLPAGITAAVMGELELGPRLLVESLEASQAADDLYGLALAMTALGVGAQSGGDNEAAFGLYTDALGIMEGLGNTYWPGQLRQNLAHFALAGADLKLAVNHLNAALDLGLRSNYPMVVALALAGFAGVLAHSKQAATAAKLLGLVATRVTVLGATFEPTDQAALEDYTRLTKESLSEAEFSSAFAAGAHWSVDQGISELSGAVAELS